MILVQTGQLRTNIKCKRQLRVLLRHDDVTMGNDNDETGPKWLIYA